ncbi:MAG: SelB C-terminal domain-containing protein [Arsenophonus endosymbiont of Dermacentor nuttalli]
MRKFNKLSPLFDIIIILRGAITVTSFGDELAIGRKLAVQILEFFDRSGFTRRKSDAHILRDKGLFE